MNILFDAFFYTDEYFELKEKGIEPEVDFDKHCVLEKILINVLTTKVARPACEKEYTEVSPDGETYYILNITFQDYLQIVPHSKAATLKSRWAN